MLSLFLCFNRDRMRKGDLIAGTWVVMATRARLDRDIAADEAAQAIIFDDAELAVYGIYELQELERVLRAGDARTMREVADTIRAKIGRPVAEEDDVFLQSYSRQLKARSEEHTSELPSLMRISYAVFCLKKQQETTRHR